MHKPTLVYLRARVSVGGGWKVATSNYREGTHADAGDAGLLISSVSISIVFGATSQLSSLQQYYHGWCHLATAKMMPH